MRLKAGDAVELFDGRGHVAEGVIETTSKRAVTVSVEATQLQPFELRHQLTLAVAMSKAHRQGYLVEKCTELGVAAIWPIIAERSVTKPGETAVEKWSRRAIEAAKQSGRAWVPTIAAVIPFAEAVLGISGFSAAFFCDLNSDSIPFQAVMTQFDNRQPKIDNPIIAFVGPEGGWTDEERQAARNAGMTSVCLSPTILRAETAAVALCAVVAAQSA